MTEEEFRAWLHANGRALVRWPYEIQPCACGDPACKGWRLVAIGRPGEAEK